MGGSIIKRFGDWKIQVYILTSLVIVSCIPLAYLSLPHLQNGDHKYVLHRVVVLIEGAIHIMG